VATRPRIMSDGQGGVGTLIGSRTHAHTHTHTHFLLPFTTEAAAAAE